MILVLTCRLQYWTQEQNLKVLINTMILSNPEKSMASIHTKSTTAVRINKQVKSSSYQSMQSLNESMGNYLILNNPKNLIKKLIPSSKLHQNMYCDTGGSSLMPKNSYTNDLSSSLQAVLAKKCSTTKNKSKKQFQISKLGTEKSLEKKNQIKKCKIDLLDSKTNYTQKGCKSVLAKSLKSSRSPSPSNPQSSYYMKPNMNMKKQPKTSQYSSSILNFGNDNQNNLKEALKGASKGGRSGLDLHRSYTNTKNISMLLKPSQRDHLNYDSFLEYLNETMKSTSSVGSKNGKIFKNSKLSKQKQVKLKKSIDSAIMPSEITMPKTTKNKGKPAHPSYGSSLSKSSSYNPRAGINPRMVASGLEASKPDYGLFPSEITYLKKPKKFKSREHSKNKPSKPQSKSKSKPKVKKSKEKSNGNLQRYKEQQKLNPDTPNSAALL